MSDIAITNGEIHCYTSKYQHTPLFYLDHQCDDWEIGDIEDAKQFVKDLQKTISDIELLVAPKESEQPNEHA